MTVVLGYVRRPECVAALDEALAVVRRTGERLVVVSAVPPGGPTGTVTTAVPDLSEVEARLTTASVPHEVRRPNRGRAAADELVDAVVATRARLLVIGLRGQRMLGRLLSGATSQQLVLDAPCDVLTVKVRPIEERRRSGE